MGITLPDTPQKEGVRTHSADFIKRLTSLGMRIDDINNGYAERMSEFMTDPDPEPGRVSETKDISTVMPPFFDKVNKTLTEINHKLDTLLDQIHRTQV